MTVHSTVADELAPLAVFRPCVLGHAETLSLQLRRLGPHLSELEQRRIARVQQALVSIDQCGTWVELSAALASLDKAGLSHLGRVRPSSAAAGPHSPCPSSGIRRNLARAFASMVDLVETMLQINEDHR